MDITEIRQKINKLMGDFISEASSEFLNLSGQLKVDKASKETIGHSDKLFKRMIEFNRTLSKELNLLINEHEKLLDKLNLFAEEKRRLEVLYTSGILFLSEIEMKQIMKKAIDTIVKELNADEGFIVLLDEEKNISSIVSSNMKVDSDGEPMRISTSVIKDAIEKLQPVQLNDLKTEVEFSKKHSIISLGLNALLCVPLISASNIIGTVYLDRKKSDMPFSESDLIFLISFAKQVVKGIEISLEINTLEEKLESEARLNQKDFRDRFNCNSIIGSSKKLFDTLRVASKVAATDATILILGENGTGKDLLANAIHKNSPRAAKPFAAFNCGAIPAELLESELFGFEAGAFTGANKSKPGKLEIADGGTVFLDEIAELSVNLQAKLLRVIQTKEIERLGSLTGKKIDIRFIAATNKNIKELIAQSKFREDLYYRLKVIEINIPSLRERKEDIEDLVDYFVEKYSAEREKFIVSSEVIEALEAYDWPGNIRELENVIQRSIILAKGNAIRLEDLPAEIIESDDLIKKVDSSKSLLEAELEFRKMYVLRAIRKTGSKSEAANLLGINRTHLYKLLNQLEIEE